ncbi:hypothetical protein [Paenibacillus abyssi]|uniref:Uncharacterized protein n=1 Tax=Paenibacillus abyssi TaxID=1340531 RepID=A0A917G4M1_9BACL|nr:hypothetical protein [Paenibacillus abyssi]GGG21580.1 hypothetical protein GCM10010916_42870 [Paenibacillus abyssi]
MKKRTWMFILGMLVIMATTAISFASTASTGTSIVVNGSGNTMTATIATALPTWTPTANRAGDIPGGTTTTGGTTAFTNGYLFDIDVKSNTDVFATLYLANSPALSKSYSYLNLNVGVYKVVDGVLTEVPDSAELLSLTNGYVTLQLSGAADGKYKIALKGGSFYCLSTTAGALAPQFTIDLR